MKQCFFITPLNDENTPQRKKAAAILETVIRPAVEPFGYEAHHAISKPYPMITHGIFRRIQECNLIVADLSGCSANVLYELGFAHTIGKSSILITDDLKTLPTDLNGMTTFQYKYSEENGIEAASLNELSLHIRNKLQEVHHGSVNSDSLILNVITIPEMIRELLNSLDDVNRKAEILRIVTDEFAADLPAKDYINLFRKYEEKIHYTHDKISKIAYGSERLGLALYFEDYCNRCKQMIKRAHKAEYKGEIITVQTPVDFDPDAVQERAAFQEYVTETIKALLIPPVRLKYRRLVIIADRSSKQVSRIKDFVNMLIDQAFEWKCEYIDNISLGFLKLGDEINSLYSNLDFHITTDKEFSIAFLSDKDKFGKSIHIYDIEEAVARDIRRDVEGIWKSANTKKLKLSTLVYNESIISEDCENYKSGLKKAIHGEIENIVNSFQNS
ncbi:MAG: hypothetical protein WC581_01730 [Thermodesulfovibrionales bacterium]